MKIKVHGRTLNIIKRLLKSCQSKIVLLVVPLEKWETLLSQARKCWFRWFWVCFIFLSLWKNQFIFSDRWCRPLFPLQLRPLTLSWNIKWVHKDEAFVSTALSPLSWYDAIPLCILTINRLWFAPGLFCLSFILLDSKIKAPLELGNVLLCLL